MALKDRIETAITNTPPERRGYSLNHLGTSLGDLLTDLAPFIEAEIERLTAELAARAPADRPEVDAEDLWMDYRTGRRIVTASERVGFLAGVEAVRAVDASRPAAPEVDDDEPLTRGARVRTVAHLTALFSPSLHPHRRADATGKIVRRMTSGDIYYDVRHDDGTVAGYERSELIDITAELVARAPADASLEARAHRLAVAFWSSSPAQPIIPWAELDEAERRAWLAAAAVDASRPGLTEEAQAVVRAYYSDPSIKDVGATMLEPIEALQAALLRASRGETGPVRDTPSPEAQLPNIDADLGPKASAVFVPTKKEAERSPTLLALFSRGATERQVILFLDRENEELRRALLRSREREAIGFIEVKAPPRDAGLADVVAASAREPHADVVLQALHVSGGAAAIGVESPVRQPWCLKCNRPVSEVEVTNQIMTEASPFQDGAKLTATGARHVRATCHGETFARWYTAEEIREHGQPPMTFFGPAPSPREP